MAALVFDEPSEPNDDSYGGLAEWLRKADSEDARAARRHINEWYEDFPDRSSMVLSRLRGETNEAILQALDELYVGHLLRLACEITYEEDASSPDFRAYRSSQYLGGIEVVTLFTERDLLSEIGR